MAKLPDRYKQDGGSSRGGLGEVLFCTDTHLDRKVAIKFIQDRAEMKRLQDELSALLQMRSKHVVQVYDIVTDDSGNFGIVEEFVDGEDLWTCEFPRQSIDNYLKTLWQIASGIADIHEAGIIHRDIKPNNMKLDSEGIVRIFDFGLARNDKIDAETVGFRGTQGFAAPELFGKGAVTFTNAIDTYAFGATAIFLAIRDLPSNMKRLPPQPVESGIFSKLPITIPSDLSELLESCLAFNPEDRTPMAKVRNMLAQHLLRDRHQAMGVINGVPSYLNSKKRVAGFEYANIGKIEIVYDGLRFLVSKVEGEVAINNSSVVPGFELPGSCVVALGASYRKPYERAFIPLDVSKPEVVL